MIHGCGLAVLLGLGVVQPAWAAPDAVYLLVRDHGCRQCRAEVFVDGELAVVQYAGEPATLVPLAAVAKPGADGQSELRVFVRGADGAGTMGVQVGLARDRSGVTVFDAAARAYRLPASARPEALVLAVDPGALTRR